MDHLYNSVVRVKRLRLDVTDGVPSMTYQQATDSDPVANDLLKSLPCRIDMNFIRPGKDIPPAPVAGKAPDRVGLLITYPYAPLRAGDLIETIPNAFGEFPVSGSFEIRAIPDEVVGYSSRHHLEVQVIETGQEITRKNWPTEDPQDYEEPL